MKTSSYVTAWLPIAAALFLPVVVAACGEDEITVPTVYGVVYSLGLTGGATIDSVKYDSGQGGLVNVANPGANWQIEFAVSEGGSIEAHAYGSIPFGGVANLSAPWAASGKQGGNVTDSVENTTQGTTIQATLDVDNRTL